MIALFSKMTQNFKNNALVNFCSKGYFGRHKERAFKWGFEGGLLSEGMLCSGLSLKGILNLEI